MGSEKKSGIFARMIARFVPTPTESTVNTDPTFERERQAQNTRNIISQGLLGAIVASDVVILIYAIASQGWTGAALAVFANGIFLGAASLSIGALLGFLFGIPRTLQSDQQPPVVTPGSVSASDISHAEGSPYRQQVNTNLEQISDWLTKILVGVGLTQLSKVPSLLNSVGATFAKPLGDNSPLAIVVVLTLFTIGFFTGYLITRLVLAPAFSDADQASMRSDLLLKRRTELAQVLTLDGGHLEARSELENVVRQITPTTAKDTKKQAYEGLVYNCLYEAPPNGFENAIRYGQEYASQEPESSRIWFYLAAAYGQKYKYGREHDQRSEDLERTRVEALKAIRRCLQIEPRMKDSIRLLWDPKAVKVSPAENDLEVFFDDKDFKELLS